MKFDAYSLQFKDHDGNFARSCVDEYVYQKMLLLSSTQASTLYKLEE
jgi:hypothetical protein